MESLSSQIYDSSYEWQDARRCRCAPGCGSIKSSWAFMSIAGVQGVSISVFGSVGRYTKLARAGNIFGVQDEQADLYWVFIVYNEHEDISTVPILTSFRGPWRTLEAIPHLTPAILWPALSLATAPFRSDPNPIPQP